MKLNKWLYIIPAALAFAATSCGYSEDPITPTGDYAVLRQTFPQGDNDFDREIQELHDKYGFYMLYKDITMPDLNRKWTSVGTDNTYYGNPLSDDEVPFYVSFIRNKILPTMDTETVRKTFPLKIYMLGDFRAIPYGMSDQPGAPGDVSYYFRALKTDGFDYWAISFKPSQMTSSDPVATKQLQCGIMYQLILQGRESGKIGMPADMRTGIDFATRLAKYTDVDDPNHPFRRGFIYWVYDDFGTSNRLHALEVTSGSDYVSYYVEGGARDYYNAYIKAAMWYTRDEFIKRYSPKSGDSTDHNLEEYPLILEKFDMVVDYFRTTVGIDLQAIAEGRQGV